MLWLMVARLTRGTSSSGKLGSSLVLRSYPLRALGWLVLRIRFAGLAWLLRSRLSGAMGISLTGTAGLVTRRGSGAGLAFLTEAGLCLQPVFNVTALRLAFCLPDGHGT